jgi:23S rRNA (guanosine2251-2'-O)-methyltransferase
MPEHDNLIIGRNPVREALRSGTPVDTVYIAQNSGGLGEIIALAKEQGAVVKTADDRKLSQLAEGGVHQGVVAFGAVASYASLDDLLEVSRRKGTKPFLILCDEIEDPHNLGAIIRTAEAAGAHGIIIPKRRSASLNHTVFKTSAGAASWLPVARVPNLPAAVDELKKSGIWIYGTDGAGENYSGVDLRGPIGLVVGSEGFGMGRLMKEKCDFLLSLPMAGKITSLNASVAAGIFMYEVVRQRTDK